MQTQSLQKHTLVGRVVHHFNMVYQLELQIESLRVALCEEYQFDVIQLFESIKMNSLQNYIDAPSLRCCLTRLKIQFTEIEIQHLLLKFSDNQNYKIYLHNFKNIVLPHDDLILLNQVLEDPDMKNGGPRTVMAYQIQERLRSLLQGELFYYTKINTSKIELFRDFQWDLDGFELCLNRKISKSILIQWLHDNQVTESIQCGELVWRRLLYMNRIDYTNKYSISKDMLAFLQPDDYTNFVSVDTQRPQSEDHFIEGNYHQQEDYLKNARIPVYVTQEWKDSKVYRSHDVVFYNNSNNVMPYQSDAFHVDYKKFQGTEVQRKYGRG